MRISIDLLPPINSLPGRFRKNDCFVCCWCVFTDCSVEQRAEITAAARNGLYMHKVQSALQKVYSEHIWSWHDHDNGGAPRDLPPGKAALIFYENSPKIGHYVILMNQGGKYLLYDPQSMTIEPFDCLKVPYSILNAYSGESLFEGKLSPRQIKYQLLSYRLNPRAEQYKIYYSIMHYLKKARKLFKQEFVENDIKELREIGNFINKVNDVKLILKKQKNARLALNDIYTRHYNKSLLGWRPGKLITIKRRLF